VAVGLEPDLAARLPRHDAEGARRRWGTVIRNRVQRLPLPPVGWLQGKEEPRIGAAQITGNALPAQRALIDGDELRGALCQIPPPSLGLRKLGEVIAQERILGRDRRAVRPEEIRF